MVIAKGRERDGERIDVGNWAKTTKILDEDNKDIDTGEEERKIQAVL